MKPIGPLMIEHRLIERMIRLMVRERGLMSAAGAVNPTLVDAAVDFLRTYADRCHHGKEDNILFKGLAAKALAADHRSILDELIEEHKRGREMVGKLLAAKDRYVAGDPTAAHEVEALLKALAAFYPAHIAKEDKRFFIPSMEYFSDEEQASMLQEFWEFDRKLIHEKYKAIVAQLEQQ